MPVYPSATAMLPAGTRTRGVARRGTASACGAPIMYGNPGAKPRNATRCSAAACSRTSSSAERPARRASGSVADDEQAAVVLRVDPPVRADGQRRVRGADRELGEYGVHQVPVPVDLVQVAVLAVREDGAVAVDRRRVHAPLEPVGMVRNARERAVAIAAAAERVRVLPAPVDLEVRGQRAHEVLLGIRRMGGVPVGRA